MAIASIREEIITIMMLPRTKSSARLINEPAPAQRVSGEGGWRRVGRGVLVVPDDC